MPKILSRDAAAELVGEFEEDVRLGYSGRGMYGEACVGYTGENLPLFSAKLAYALAQQDDPEIEDMAAHELLDAIADLPDASTDSMGRGIIYYWPGIRCEEEVNSDG